MRGCDVAQENLLGTLLLVRRVLEVPILARRRDDVNRDTEHVADGPQGELVAPLAAARHLGEVAVKGPARKEAAELRLALDHVRHRALAHEHVVLLGAEQLLRDSTKLAISVAVYLDRAQAMEFEPFA